LFFKKRIVTVAAAIALSESKTEGKASFSALNRSQKYDLAGADGRG